MEATRGAVRELERLLAAAREEEVGVRVGEVYACRINAGLFGVEWGKTRAVLVGEGFGWWVVGFERGDGASEEAAVGRDGLVSGSSRVAEGRAGLDQDGATVVARRGKRRRVG